MSDIATWARKYRLEVAWALFSAANLVAMLVVPRWETVPFHFVWVSLTLLYGLHVWTIRTTSIVLAVVVVTTGVIIVLSTIWYHENIDEITEVPLMAAMFVAMVWHARRHKAAVELVQQMVQKERHMRTAEEAFVRTASHELRTPITVAHGHAELARRVQTDPDAIADLDLVIEELDRLGTLSSRLLTLAAVNGSTLLATQDGRRRRADRGVAVVGGCRRRLAGGSSSRAPRARSAPTASGSRPPSMR